MKSRLILFIVLTAMVSCVKETYDMDKFSDRIHLSPAWVISAVKGDISLKDILEPNDTIVFDEDDFVRIVFREDSILDFKMADFYDLNDMVAFSEAYQIGDLNLAPFQGTIGYTLDQISTFFNPALRAQLVAFDDGSTHNFPPFPATSLGERNYSLFTNFEYATFSAGSIDISFTNNLTAPVSGLRITLYNTVSHTQIGSEINITQVNPGQTGTGSLDLAGLTITNSLTAAVVINGSPGTSTPVLIDLDGSNIEIKVSGRDMKVSSGRVVLPLQPIESLDGSDTVDFDPGSDIEIDVIKITTGNLSYTLNGESPLKVSLTLTLPTGLRDGVPVTKIITINPGTIINGTISLDNTTIDLGTIASQPYNLLPLDYNIEVSSDGSMVTFNSTDQVSFDMELLNPEFDYVKGYFGQRTESIDPDSIDLEIEDILNHITGDFLISNPSITLNYSNSFAVPIEIEFNATGFRGSESTDLGLNPFILGYPAAPLERDKSGTFTIDRNNSELPELISMPPEKVRFSGSAVLNPDGNTGARDNYIFGDSRFLGSLEVEVPLEFRLNNLQFSDTIDNFMKMDEQDNDSPVTPEDFEYVRINFTAENGFPLGMSLSMSLYDSVTGTVKSSVSADNILEPAPVGSDGRVTQPTETETSIEITREFWNSVDNADMVILKFSASTTDNGTKDVKIYSDYSISFKIALAVKADINF